MFLGVVKKKKKKRRRLIKPRVNSHFIQIFGRRGHRGPCLKNNKVWWIGRYQFVFDVTLMLCIDHKASFTISSHNEGPYRPRFRSSKNKNSWILQLLELVVTFSSLSPSPAHPPSNSSHHTASHERALFYFFSK